MLPFTKKWHQNRKLAKLQFIVNKTKCDMMRACDLYIKNYENKNRDQYFELANRKREEYAFAFRNLLKYKRKIGILHDGE